MTPWTELEPARTVGRGISAAVRCASLADPSGYALATAALGELPLAPTGAVLGAVVRMLLEDVHPGGLDGDDIRKVLGRCLAETAGWLPEAVSARILIAVLSSALGIHEAGVTYSELLAPTARSLADEWVDPEPVPSSASAVTDSADAPQPPTAAEYDWHAPLLIADLLAITGRPLSAYLDAAFADIARSEEMEMP